MSGRDGHLGELVAALVDGALDGNTRDRALAHVAGCAPCRGEVDDQRRIKDRLRRLDAPELAADLTERLRAVAGSSDVAGTPDAGSPGAHLVSGSAHRSGTARLRPAATGSARRPGGTARPPLASRRPSRPSGAGRRTRRVAGGVTALALGLVVVVAFGPGRHQGPSVSPPVGQFTVEHAQTTGGFPGADPGAGAVMTVSVNR